MTPSGKGVSSTFLLQQCDVTHSAVGPPATRCLCRARMMGVMGAVGHVPKLVAVRVRFADLRTVQPTGSTGSPTPAHRH